MLSLTLFAAVSAYSIGLQDADASSTFSEGNLIGSPGYAASMALSAGSGYWCSAGSHGPGEIVTWTGKLSADRLVKAVQISWVYAPEEVRVLTSPDMSTYEEAACFRPAGSGRSFVQTITFDRAMPAMGITIAMKGAQHGYFGISEVSMTPVAMGNEPIMLVSGMTSPKELCLVAENGHGDQAGALTTLEACDKAAADGRSLWQMTADGQLMSSGGLCMLLAGNDANHGGSVILGDCDQAALTDGRSYWEMQPNAQMKMSRSGNYCLTLQGDAPEEGDIAQKMNAKASSTADGSDAGHVKDGDMSTSWESRAGASGPVTMELSFQDGIAKRVSKITIDWSAPASSFDVELAREDGRWVTFASASGQGLSTTTLTGESTPAKAMRIIMKKPGVAAEGYGIRSVGVFVGPSKMQVADCGEAALQNADARDKFFVQQVPEFDPKSNAAAAVAPMFDAAVNDLAILTAELEAAKACQGALVQTDAAEKAHQHSDLSGVLQAARSAISDAEAGITGTA